MYLATIIDSCDRLEGSTPSVPKGVLPDGNKPVDTVPEKGRVHATADEKEHVKEGDECHTSAEDRSIIPKESVCEYC